jgi:colanic acid biosynthesis glycosyl transferase WcaI
MTSRVKPLHFVIHSQYYPPEIGAPQARLSELAKGLVKRGHQVTVLTAMPNYPRGKIYPGFGGLLQREQQDGIQIIRSAIFATQRANMVPRLTTYFSFVISSFLFGSILIHKPDYLLTESPPLFLGIAGYLLSRVKKTRWIFNVSDLWPESAVRLGFIKDGWALRLSYWLEAFCYKKAWIVTGQSRSILLDIKQRFPKIKIYHFSNGVNARLFGLPISSTLKNQVFGNDSRVVILYAGLHGVAQGLEQILLADYKMDKSAFDIIFLGDGPEKQLLIKKTSELGLNNVHFWEPCTRDQMPSILAAADICLIPLKMYLPGAVPSKLYEAMASGKPVMLIAEGEAAQIVNDNGAGIVIKPGDIDGIVQGLQCLVSNAEMRQTMGMAGKQAAELNFDREKIVQVFIDLLEL